MAAFLIGHRMTGNVTVLRLVLYGAFVASGFNLSWSLGANTGARRRRYGSTIR